MQRDQGLQLTRTMDSKCNILIFHRDMKTFHLFIFQRRDFLWGYAVFGFCTLGARDKKRWPGNMVPDGFVPESNARNLKKCEISLGGMKFRSLE